MFTVKTIGLSVAFSAFANHDVIWFMMFNDFEYLCIEIMKQKNCGSLNGRLVPSPRELLAEAFSYSSCEPSCEEKGSSEASHEPSQEFNSSHEGSHKDSEKASGKGSRGLGTYFQYGAEKRAWDKGGDGVRYEIGDAI